MGVAYQIDRPNFNGWDDWAAHLTQAHEASVILPLFFYDHSGITLETIPINKPAIKK